jgi:hypothetical protein
MKKPPLGVLPVNIWKENRAGELVSAMGRWAPLLQYADNKDQEAARDLIDKWARELVDLNLPRGMPF